MSDKEDAKCATELHCKQLRMKHLN